jgi:Ras-related protein Rab-2A
MWLGDVRAHADPNLTCILVGNKVDLCDTDAISGRREVPQPEAEAWAQEEGLLFVEASAKSGENVEDAFVRAATDILGKIRHGVFDDNRVSDCVGYTPEKD